MTIGYYKLPPNNATVRQVADVVNLLVDGKFNGGGQLTLAANTTTTTITDYRAGSESTILLTATNANAAAENPYISAQSKQSFTITHSSAASTDRTFNYLVVG